MFFLYAARWCFLHRSWNFEEPTLAGMGIEMGNCFTNMMSHLSRYPTHPNYSLCRVYGTLRVSEGNPRFSKPVLKCGFSTGMYVPFKLGLVRVTYGFSTG